MYCIVTLENNTVLPVNTTDICIAIDIIKKRTKVKIREVCKMEGDIRDKHINRIRTK